MKPAKSIAIALSTVGAMGSVLFLAFEEALVDWEFFDALAAILGIAAVLRLLHLSTSPSAEGGSVHFDAWLGATAAVMALLSARVDGTAQSLMLLVGGMFVVAGVSTSAASDTKIGGFEAVLVAVGVVLAAAAFID